MWVSPRAPGHRLRGKRWGRRTVLAIASLDRWGLLEGLGLTGKSQANNSLEPTRNRGAKMEAGLADVATTRSRVSIAGERPTD